MTRQVTLLLCGIALLAACAKEPPPRTVSEFIDNPLLLEAAMVRCSQDRSKNRYEAECVNARQAVARIQAKEESERQAELEASSERKRRALRRTQEAAAEARRRAAEAERQRREAEYLAQFGVLPPSEEDETADTLPDGNLPTAIVPQAVDEPQAGASYTDTAPVVDGGNAPVAEPEPEPEPETEPPSDLASIRDELKRRNEDDDN